MKSVFSSYGTHSKTKDNVIRDAKPKPGPQPWRPNREEFFRLVMPHERGNFFRRAEKSGTGSVGGE